MNTRCSPFAHNYLSYLLDGFSGFVTVHQNWSIDEMNIRGPFLKNEFKKMMAIKAILESECKLKAIEWGYDYYLSVDLDEYVVPSTSGQTFVDEVERWTNATGRQVNLSYHTHDPCI